MPMTSPRMLLSLALPEVTPVVPRSINLSAPSTSVSIAPDRYVAQTGRNFLTTLVDGSIVYATSEALAIQERIEEGNWHEVTNLVTYAQSQPYNASIWDVISLIAYYEADFEGMDIPDDVIRATFQVDPDTADDVTDMCDVITGLARLTKYLAQHKRWTLIDELLTHAMINYRSGSRRAVARQILKLGKQHVPPKTLKLAKQTRPWLGLVWRTPTLDKIIVSD